MPVYSNRILELVLAAACAAALALFTIETSRAIGEQRPDAGFLSSDARIAEEASFILDNTKVTLQRFASELGGRKRYLTVEAGASQKIRSELARDPGGWAHFDICETELGDIALRNSSPHPGRGDDVYLIRLGPRPRIAKVEPTQILCGRSIGRFDENSDREYAFQSTLAQ